MNLYNKYTLNDLRVLHALDTVGDMRSPLIAVLWIFNVAIIVFYISSFTKMLKNGHTRNLFAGILLSAELLIIAVQFSFIASPITSLIKYAQSPVMYHADADIADRIIVKTDKNLTKSQKDDINYLKHIIEYSPSKLTENASRIYIMDEANYVKAGEQHNMSDVKRSGGFTVSSMITGKDSKRLEEIYLKLNTDSSIASNYTASVIHELYHAKDYVKSPQYSDSSLIKKKYSQNPKLISDYGSENLREFFAEAGAMYITDPDSLKQKDEDIYDYMSRIAEASFCVSSQDKSGKTLSEICA